jgi:hypothetical protein
VQQYPRLADLKCGIFRIRAPWRLPAHWQGVEAAEAFAVIRQIERQGSLIKKLG